MKIEGVKGTLGDLKETVGMRKQIGDGGISLTVSPDQVDMTLFLSSGGSEVIIHSGDRGNAEAMVRAPGGELRYYRLDDDLNPRDDIPGAEGDLNMIRSAAAMLAGEFDSMASLDGFERFNPFEEGSA